MQKLNQKFYDHYIVKDIVKNILVEAIENNIKLEDIEDFIEANFDNVINRLVKK